MKRIGIAELKDNLSRLLRGVEAGEPIEVLDRTRPIARIVPIDRPPAVTILPARRPFASVRDLVFPPVAPGVSSDEILREERRERIDPDTWA